MRNPSQALLLAVLMASLIMPPGLFAAGGSARKSAPSRSVLLVGDSLSIGLGQQLEAAYAGCGTVRFHYLGKVSSGLASPSFFDWNAHLTDLAKSYQPDVVLIMVGANDDKNLPGSSGRAAVFGSKEWDAAYAERLSRLHAIVRSYNPRALVYYIGVPVMASASFDASMRHVNGVLAHTARSLPDASYIDVRGVLATADGAFAPMARGAGGSVVKLRAGDGVHISATGSRLLAAHCLQALGGEAGAPVGQLVAGLDTGWQPVASGTPAKAPTALAEAAPVAKPVVQPATASAPKTESKPVLVADAAPATVSDSHPAIAVRPTATVAARPVIAAQAVPAVQVPAKPVAKPAAPATSGSYTVASGDTLHAVAKRLGVPTATLAAANPDVDPRRMSIGQVLAVPAGASLPALAQAASSGGRAAPAHGRVHVVAGGDNYWSVARDYDVSVASLAEANPGVDPTRLRIGQQLAIPGAPSAPAVAGKGYVVADGDNFWAIARHLGVDVDALKRANASVDPQRLQPGQLLSVPATVRAAADEPAPVAGNEGAPSLAGDGGLYPVSKGDTMWGLARRFGVSLDTMLSANSELDPSHLQVGQLVTIPTGAPLAAAEGMLFPVASGDTLWSIARRFDVAVDSLLAANPGIDPLHLREGQTLRVPSSLAAVAASAGGKTPSGTATRPGEAAASSMDAVARRHTVSSGDTVWDLSRRYGVPVERLLAANTGVDPSRLRVGQTLVVPEVLVSMAAR